MADGGSDEEGFISATRLAPAAIGAAAYSFFGDGAGGLETGLGALGEGTLLDDELEPGLDAPPEEEGIQDVGLGEGEGHDDGELAAAEDDDAAFLGRPAPARRRGPVAASDDVYGYGEDEEEERDRIRIEAARRERGDDGRFPPPPPPPGSLAPSLAPSPGSLASSLAPPSSLASDPWAVPAPGAGFPPADPARAFASGAGLGGLLSGGAFAGGVPGASPAPPPAPPRFLSRVAGGGTLTQAALDAPAPDALPAHPGRAAALPGALEGAFAGGAGAAHSRDEASSIWDDPGADLGGFNAAGAFQAPAKAPAPDALPPHLRPAALPPHLRAAQAAQAARAPAPAGGRAGAAHHPAAPLPGAQAAPLGPPAPHIAPHVPAHGGSARPGHGHAGNHHAAPGGLLGPGAPPHHRPGGALAAPRGFAPPPRALAPQQRQQQQQQQQQQQPFPPPPPPPAHHHSAEGPRAHAAPPPPGASSAPSSFRAGYGARSSGGARPGSSGSGASPALRARISECMTRGDLEYIASLQARGQGTGVAYDDDYYNLAFLSRHAPRALEVALGGEAAFAPAEVRSLDPTERAEGDAVLFAQGVGLGRVAYTHLKRPRPLLDLVGKEDDKKGEPDAGAGDAAAKAASPGPSTPSRPASAAGAAEERAQQTQGQQTSSRRPLSSEPAVALRLVVEDCESLLLDVADASRLLARLEARAAARAENARREEEEERAMRQLIGEEGAAETASALGALALGAETAAPPRGPAAPWTPALESAALALLSRRTALLDGLADSLRLAAAPRLADDAAGATGDRIALRLAAMRKGARMLAKAVAAEADAQDGYGIGAEGADADAGADKEAAAAKDAKGTAATGPARLPLRFPASFPPPPPARALWSLLRQSRALFSPSGALLAARADGRSDSLEVARLLARSLEEALGGLRTLEAVSAACVALLSGDLAQSDWMPLDDLGGDRQDDREGTAAPPGGAADAAAAPAAPAAPAAGLGRALVALLRSAAATLRAERARERAQAQARANRPAAERAPRSGLSRHVRIVVESANSLLRMFEVQEELGGHVSDDLWRAAEAVVAGL